MTPDERDLLLLVSEMMAGTRGGGGGELAKLCAKIRATPPPPSVNPRDEALLFLLRYAAQIADQMPAHVARMMRDIEATAGEQ